MAKWAFCVVTAIIMLAAPSFAAGVRVVDGDTLELAGVRYRLLGIDAPEAGQTCQTQAGKYWPCGKAATEHLIELIAGAHSKIACIGSTTDDYDRVLAHCVGGTVDLNSSMVSDGFAWAFRRYSEEYVGLEDHAQSTRVGIWQAATETPWEYRDKRWRVAKQASPNGCPIKGNISDGGRIYHAPWSPWYDRTRITLAKGERWFCSEREAIDAGWRAPIWGQ